jgi:hypothetical protein
MKLRGYNMNKKDLENLNEAYQQINETHRFENEKWLKIIKNEMGIGPIGMARENVVSDMYKQISDRLFPWKVREVQGKQMRGIKIMFDDGTTGLAFGVNHHSTVSNVLAATYKSYRDTFEKIAEELIASSGDEYEGM